MLSLLDKRMQSKTRGQMRKCLSFLHVRAKDGVNCFKIRIFFNNIVDKNKFW